MFYNKEYFPTDYFSSGDINELKAKVETLLNEFDETIDTSNYPIWDIETVAYITTDYPYIEDIDAIEKSIELLSYDFYRPAGYINNKTWIEDNTQATFKTFSYEDMNRMIKDVNLLHDHKIDTISMYNLYSHEEWNNGVTSLTWEE